MARTPDDIEVNSEKSATLSSIEECREWKESGDWETFSKDINTVKNIRIIKNMGNICSNMRSGQCL